MAKTYNLYRNGTKIKDSITTTNYTDDTVQPDTEYNYQVSSVDEEGESSLTPAISVTTLPIAVTGISLNPISGSVIVGSTLQINASITPANATDQSIKYSSSDTTIATVDTTGKVTGVKEGTCNIVATSNADSSKSATFALTVTTV